MMKPIGIALLAGALLALTATSGLAQRVVSARSGTVNLTEGAVELDGRKLESSITRYPEVKEGGVLRTDDGRAEVLLTPGVTLRVGDHSSFKMLTNRLIDTRLELLGGSAVVEAAEVGKDTSVTLVVHGAAVSLPKAGIYRFDFDPAQLKVFKGEAAVQTGAETTLVGSGRVCALGGATVAVSRFHADDTDALDHWSRRRGELMSMANTAGVNSLASSGGWYGAGSSLGLLSGCSGFGNSMMFGFGYGGYPLPYSYSGYGRVRGLWSYNSWYDMYTYMPCGSMMVSPYGYPYAGVGTVAKQQPTQPTRRPAFPVQLPVHPVRGPGTGPAPLRVPVTLAERRPLVWAVNGFHAPTSSGGMHFAPGYHQAASVAFSGPSSTGSVGWSGTGVSSSTGISTSSAPSIGSSGGTAVHVGGAISGAMTGGGGGHSGGISHR
jgi:hypothetical protein